MVGMNKIDKLKLLKRICKHCQMEYDYYPDEDPPEASQYCSPVCLNCVVAGSDPDGNLLAPCPKHARNDYMKVR